MADKKLKPCFCLADRDRQKTRQVDSHTDSPTERIEYTIHETSFQMYIGGSSASFGKFLTEISAIRFVSDRQTDRLKIF